MSVSPLVGKQAASVALATRRTNVWEGSVRSSKTVCSLLAWLNYVRTGPAGNLAMVGKTERTLKRNIIDPLTDMLGRSRCKANWGDGELMLLGRRIYLAGANDERAHEKIRGLTLAGAYVDEGSVVPESFWSMLLTRLSVDGAKLFATTNPDNPTHWLKRDYLDRAATWLHMDGTVTEHEEGLDLARFSFRLRDNPHLSESYIKAVSSEFTGLWYLRFIEGQWVLADGAIYDMFDPIRGGRHVVVDLPEIVRWAVGIDYGTTNAFVALLLGEGVDGKLYVAREWRWDSKRERRQLTDAEYASKLRTWLDELDPPTNDFVPGRLAGAREPEFLFVDPSAASFITQLSRDGWSGVRGADNAVDDGIRDVANLYSRDLLRVHESCQGLIDETVGYVWDEKAAKRGEDKPVKTADHGPDALRYSIRGTRRWWRKWVAGLEVADAA